MKSSKLLCFLIYIGAALSCGPIEKMRSTFPNSFSFGVSTAAYQIEGGWNSDGKGPSNWDTFTHNYPDKIMDRSSADVACNSYLKFEKDLKALKELKVRHYRFSISWSRIMSKGDNATYNQKGVDYYNKVINLLIENNITPMVTMVHYDTPQELMILGGWTNPVLVDYFTDYAITLYQLFGDRVKKWITFNEPIDVCTAGYGHALYPPLMNKSGIADYLCIHNILKAHGSAYKAYKDQFYKQQKGKIGITLDTRFFFSKTKDKNVVYRALQYNLGILAHPIFSSSGGYPEVMIQEIASNSLKENRTRSRLPQFDILSRNLIKGSADFLGLNYYTSRYVEEQNPAVGEIPSYERDTRLNFLVDPKWIRGKSPWLYCVPSGLEELLKYIRDEYHNVEVIITENGWSDDGQLDDHGRIDYMRTHLQAILNAIDVGCNVSGYTTWSLMDNFEWLKGYTERFGLYYVNFTNTELERVPKLSSKFYAKICETYSIPEHFENMIF